MFKICFSFFWCRCTNDHSLILIRLSLPFFPSIHFVFDAIFENLLSGRYNILLQKYAPHNLYANLHSQLSKETLIIYSYKAALEKMEERKSTSVVC